MANYRMVIKSVPLKITDANIYEYIYIFLSRYNGETGFQKYFHIFEAS